MARRPLRTDEVGGHNGLPVTGTEGMKHAEPERGQQAQENDAQGLVALKQ